MITAVAYCGGKRTVARRSTRRRDSGCLRSLSRERGGYAARAPPRRPNRTEPSQVHFPNSKTSTFSLVEEVSP